MTNTQEMLEQIRAKAAELEASLMEDSERDDESDEESDEDDEVEMKEAAKKKKLAEAKKPAKVKEDEIVDADDEEESDDEESDEDDEKNESFDISSIFEGENLSTGFKNKVTALVEATVAERVENARKRLSKLTESRIVELEQTALNESSELKEGLVEKIDGYLDYVVEQWMENNELALERGIRGELFESFMNGMKNLFEEHHVNVSDEQLDVIQEMRSEMEELTNRLDEMTEQNVELKQVFKEVERQSQIAEAVEGLSDLDAEKFKTLAEELVFDDGETFARKLEVVRENFFQKTETKKLNEGILDTEAEIITEETVKPATVMDTYARILARNN